MKKYLVAMLLSVTAQHATAQNLTDSVQLKAFMDGIMLTHLRDKHIAGATLSIVKDGKTLLAQGYGFADLKKRIPVTGDSTLFRIGSISKMFTWISVMKLVSEGKLKLDEDINHYLKDFKIPETYPQPITLNHLMTHTPGFEDVIIGLFSRDSSSLKPLGTILKKELPERVRPPGTFASYSNHGTGIAAYIVEQVSGMSFNQYVENNILIPLQMNVTTFRQPLPRFLKPMMSKGYKYKDRELQEEPFEFVPLYPVGAASTSATDMVHFMNMILNGGRYHQVQVIDSTTLQVMEMPAHRHHPAVNPMRHGFIDMSRNGVTVIGHGGDTFWFHSMMALFPETNTGLFVSFNSDTGGGVAGEVVKEFMDRYYPERNPLVAAKKVSLKFLQRFEGAYRVNRYAYHDITTFASMLGDLEIKPVDSSRLRLSFGENVKYFVPIDSLTFREEHTSEIMAFKSNQKGDITEMFIGNLPIIVFDRVRGLSSAAVHQSIFAATAIITVIMLFYWPVTSRARRGYEPTGSIMKLPPGAKITGWINYFMLAAFYSGLLLALQDPTSIVYGVPTIVKVLLIIPFLIILTTLIMILQLYRILNQKRYHLWSRVFYLLITIMSIAALWQLYYWNYIGFNY